MESKGSEDSSHIPQASEFFPVKSDVENGERTSLPTGEGVPTEVTQSSGDAVSEITSGQEGPKECNTM